ncbi:MAG: lytic transglycosylase domain-containing protein [Myxococcales bacterium]|nr:lytic transglycosylase domain-containing protein [Myxococcales bacterium]
MPTLTQARRFRAVARQLWRSSLMRALGPNPWTVTWLLLGLCLTAGACAGSQPGVARSPGMASGSGPEPSWPEAQREQIAAVQPEVNAAARRFQIDPGLVNGLIWVESKFNARARGPGGTQGLMQLMPATARELAKSLGERPRPYDPGFNIRAGSLYLSRMIKRFGDVKLGLAAYHGGPGHVLKWQKAGKRGVPDGSKKYVEKVFAARDRF